MNSTDAPDTHSDSITIQDSAAVDPAWANAFMTEHDHDKAMCSSIVAFATKATCMNDKVKSLGESLVKKPEWMGAMTRTTMAEHKFEDEFVFKDKLDGVGHVGSSTWLAVCRPLSWRLGPQAWPRPGFGCFVKLHSVVDALDVHLITMPMAEAVKEGISLIYVAAFWGPAPACRPSRPMGKSGG